MLIQFQTVARFEKGSHVKNEMTASMAFFNGLRFFFCERLAGGVQSMSSKVSLLQHSKFSWKCVCIWHAGYYNMTHMISVCDSTNPTYYSKKAFLNPFLSSVLDQLNHKLISCASLSRSLHVTCAFSKVLNHDTFYGDIEIWLKKLACICVEFT